MSQYREPKKPATKSTRLFDLLAYTGIGPFALGIWLEVTGENLGGIDGGFLFAAYSACILSFLCGIWWAAALNRADHPHRLALTLLSNLVCLSAWLGLLVYRTPWGLAILASGFAYMRWAEARLNPNGRQLRGYFKTRSRVTYVVIACHLSMLALEVWH
ncbi:DUF3429 domain-containing protein [Microbulbifer discodermiae]|uniref:DUF3429 domain-containing protein n=1 Tax=Microbulbifer sp. 2201CG32-9 TaxID=3232309 RepID=UPI00345BFADC